MLYCLRFKFRPISDEQLGRMMTINAKVEEDLAASPLVSRVALYMDLDGRSGIDILDVVGTEEAVQFLLEMNATLAEFIEIDTRPVLALESAMPALMRAMERTAS